MTITHAFDLPNINQKPTFETLKNALEELELPKLTDFEPSDVAEIPGLFDWLVKLTASSLDWINDTEHREHIWTMSSKCMAERCGRTAAPTRVREMHISEDIVVDLIEPSLTADLLGLKTWGSSFLLAKRLYRDFGSIVAEFDHSKPNTKPETNNGIDILELGGGTGLCAIALAKLGYNIISTDLAEIIDNMQQNIQLNGVTDRAKAVELDWRAPGKFAYSHEKFDVVIVSDPIYSPEHPKLVVDVIQRYLSTKGLVVVQLPLRSKYEREREDFYGLLSSIGLERVRYDEESGFDDFGQQNYAFSVWQ